MKVSEMLEVYEGRGNQRGHLSGEAREGGSDILRVLSSAHTTCGMVTDHGE
jgi:hypothetical protein